MPLQGLKQTSPSVETGISGTPGWRQRLDAAALPEEKLNGRHQGMTQLQQLADRLNGLDEQCGKYMTVSELKSAVFTMMQSFNSAVPAEEQLRQLSQAPEGQPLPASLKNQTNTSLATLLSRYTLITSRSSTDVISP